jgi:cytochrome c oxidase subunit 2
VFRTQASPPHGSLSVEVIGHQWWWEIRYPELGITTANELHLPVGRPVSLSLKSADVIHSFWVPRLGGKRDLVGGKVNHLVFTVDEPGEYPGQCAEFCGASHANMRLTVIAQSPADFEAWTKRLTATPIPPSGEAAKGHQAFLATGCVACHAIQGVAAGVVGPNLTHVGSRKTLAGGILKNNPEDLARWLRNPPGVKPGALMPKLPLSDDQVAALVAYLGSLR